MEIALVLYEETFHGAFDGWRMDPVNRIHLFDKGTLADDGSDQVDREGEAVFPVARHHAAYLNPDLFIQPQVVLLSSCLLLENASYILHASLGLGFHIRAVQQKTGKGWRFDDVVWGVVFRVDTRSRWSHDIGFS